MEKTKLQKVKEAIKNPPPERLAKIEYQSNFLQMVGITIVSIVLIYKGLWYIIFAFIFSLGISYSQGMNAYRKYKNIQEFLPKERPEEFEKDISPSRRRGKIIEYVFGGKVRWMAVIISVIITYLIVKDMVWWLKSLLVFPTVLFLFIALYFFVIYNLAYPIYKKRMKRGEDEK